jgi:hypothetical protein
MKTFTFYARRSYTVREECPYSVNADNLIEAKMMFIQALRKGKEDEYCTDHWYLKDNDIIEELSYHTENYPLIWLTMKTEQYTEELKKGGWVAFLWHVDDIKQNYNVTDEQAIEILQEVQYNDYVVKSVYEAIDDLCEQYEYERIDE